MFILPPCWKCKYTPCTDIAPIGDKSEGLINNKVLLGDYREPPPSSEGTGRDCKVPVLGTQVVTSGDVMCTLPNLQINLTHDRKANFYNFGTPAPNSK